ncbi:MAG TPA: hypothetical protein PL041_14420 [Melioribacteraceae bacterium]|nr:hypothetical protein [Melioribacteraceae bacterium]
MAIKTKQVIKPKMDEYTEFLWACLDNDRITGFSMHSYKTIKVEMPNYLTTYNLLMQMYSFIEDMKLINSLSYAIEDISIKDFNTNSPTILIDFKRLTNGN